MYAGGPINRFLCFFLVFFFFYQSCANPLSIPLSSQLQNQSELRAPTADKAAFYLDAAIAARSTSRPNVEEDERRNSHMLFTLHVYQYRMEKSGKGGS